MKRRVFHLKIKATGEHKYYGSLAAVFLDNDNLGVSKFTLDRFEFEKAAHSEFENEVCVIRKDWLMSANDIRTARK